MHWLYRFGVPWRTRDGFPFGLLSIGLTGFFYCGLLMIVTGWEGWLLFSISGLFWAIVVLYTWDYWADLGDRIRAHMRRKRGW